jgi:hypothetical protein
VGAVMGASDKSRNACRTLLYSEDYEQTFYGIINRSGELWTPNWFASKQAAQAYLADIARRWGPKFNDLPRTHKIVPVRFWIDVLPAQGMSAGTEKTPQAAEGEARQPGPQDAPNSGNRHD